MARARREPDLIALLALQIHNYVRNRDCKAFARAADDALLEPVRPAFGMGRDDDLVGPESAERVLDRLQRLAVADLAARLNAGLHQSRETSVEALLRSVPRLVVVRDPVLERRVQARRDDQHLGARALAAAANRIAQRLAADRLVGDYQNPPLVLGGMRPGRREDSCPPPYSAAEVEEEHDRAENDEDRESDPAIDQGSRDDQPEVADRQPDEAIRLGLAAKRVQRHAAPLEHVHGGEHD